MAIELSLLQSFNVPVTIKDGGGKVIATFNVKRKAIGFDEWDEIQGRQSTYAKAQAAQEKAAKEAEEKGEVYQDNGSLKAVKELLVENLVQMLCGWDIQESGQAVEPSRERLARFDAGVISQLHEQVMEHANPNPKKSETA